MITIPSDEDDLYNINDIVAIVKGCMLVTLPDVFTSVTFTVSGYMPSSVLFCFGCFDILTLPLQYLKTLPIFPPPLGREGER